MHTLTHSYTHSPTTGSEDKESIRSAVHTLCTHTHTLTHSHNHTQLVAKTKRAYVELQRQFAKRLIKKEYHALVEGCVDGEQVKGSRD